MDSFYDAPRRPPQPIPRETFSATPVVPEISVLCPSNTPKNTFTPYNQWKKDTMPNNFCVLNKENISGHFQNTSILKKQVRFESPVLQQKFLGSNEPIFNKTEQNSSKNLSGSDSNSKPHDQLQAIQSFEQMYMANIPNRQLDLSVIDLPKRVPQNEIKNQYGDSVFTNENKNVQAKEQPKTYKEFLETRKIDKKIVLNDSVTDIYNYKRNIPTKNSFSPKVLHNFPKADLEETVNNLRNPDTSALSPNVYQQTFKTPRHDKNEIIEKKEPVKENVFQCVTEAISRRNIPAQYENAYYYTQGVEQIRNSENVTQQNPWFVSQNYDSGGFQNRVLPVEVRSQSKSSPHKSGNDIRNKHFFNRRNSEDTENNHCIETIGVENRRNNLVRFKPQAGPTVVCHNSASPNSCKPSSYPVYNQEKHECYTQTSSDLSIIGNNALKTTNDDDLSIKDLLKIISQQSQQMAQQNEQVLLLQKQITELICQKKDCEYPTQKSIQCGQEKKIFQHQNNYDQSLHCCSQKRQCEQKQVFMPGPTQRDMENIQDRCITSTQHENCDGIRNTLEDTLKKNKNNMPNFSIGLTTSVEVSFRRPQYNKNQNEFLQKNKDLPDSAQYEPPKIQEITETDSTQSNENYRGNIQQDCEKNTYNDNRETLVDDSFIFQEPIRVRESCPSPEPSIMINMNDFEDSDSEDELTSPEIGASFYRNLMLQVNKILQKAEIETAEVAYNVKGRNLKSNTLLKVKEATLKHLKRIGVEVQNSEDKSQSNSLTDSMDNKSYNQDEISFAVKQLLMKYLPADHLAKIASTEVASGNNAVLTPKGKIGAIKNRPDFSFATVQYMKKYNLIANNQRDFCQAAKQNQPESPKILDITKLKQQPKLL